MTIRIIWHDSGRSPQCAPDPRYPLGVDLDLSKGAEATCSEQLKYPAPRCGVYFACCDICKQTALITVAGRPDDPRSIKLACRKPERVS